LKKNILKYSSLLALLGSTFFSTQTFAAECATGTVPATGCRVDVSNITYTLTGDITSGAAQGAGILFDSDSAIINYTGAISVEAMGVGFDIGADNNTMNMTGNINIAAGSNTRRGVIFQQGENNTLNLTGNILTANELGIGVYYAGGSANTGAVEGNITTTGDTGHGIAFDNSNLNNYTQTGNIATSGNAAHGIYLLNISTDETGSDSNTINMTGNITTTGDNSYGIYSYDELRSLDNSDVTLRGNISTATNSSYAIYLRNSDSNTYTLIGDISTAGNSSRAMYIRSSDSNTINMTGNISTIGQSAHGMRLSTSHSNVISFDGNITTSGESATGVYIRNSDNNTTTLSGNISTTATGDGGETGLYLQYSDGNTTTLIGNISVEGENATGLEINEGINNTTTLTGNITTSGEGAFGVYFRNGSDNNTIDMTGNITTTADGALGIFLSRSDSNDITINGNMTTSGANTSGVYFYNSDSNTFTIKGNIITSGAGGSAEPFVLDEFSDSNTFIVSGAIHSLGGDQSISVSSNSQNNTFTFKRGASFIGGLENDGGTTNTLRFDMGKASSYNLETEGSTLWTLEDTSKPIVSGSAKSMGVADIDNQAHILYRRMDPVNDVLSERQRLYKEGQRPTGYYIDSYYGHDKRNEDYSEISGNAGGMTVGYVLENTNTPMEVLVNFEVSQDNYGSGLAKQTTETNSVMAGLFLPALVEDVMGGNISAKVLVSGSDNDAKRTVLNNSLGLTKASEKVSGDYNSGFISAGAEWLTEFLKVERVRHDISIGADLVQAYNEDYTAGEYKVDSRDMTQIQSRILYGMTYKNAKKSVDVNTRFGVSNQYMVSGDKQDYKINGTSTSYTGDDNSFYYTAGLGAKYYLADNTNLYVDTKYGQSSDDIQNMTIDFGFISRF
jgi:hypothetical protein